MFPKVYKIPTKMPVDVGTFKACVYYIQLLEEKKVRPIDHTEITNGDPTSLEHLLWMLYEIINNIRDDGHGYPTSKYSRWLGYVQGCLICHKVTTVEQERNRTRGWFTNDATN